MSPVERLRPSEREGLRPPADFAPPVFAQGVYRPAWQRVVGSEQPYGGFDIIETDIGQQRQCAAQSLDDFAAVKTIGGDALIVSIAQRNEFTFANPLPDFVGRNLQFVGRFPHRKP